MDLSWSSSARRAEASALIPGVRTSAKRRRSGRSVSFVGAMEEEEEEEIIRREGEPFDGHREKTCCGGYCFIRFFCVFVTC